MADAAAELDEGGVVRTLKDLFAGAAGGIAQVLLGESGVLFCGSCAIECHHIFPDHVRTKVGGRCTVATLLCKELLS
jgi:hypothetical protein